MATSTPSQQSSLTREAPFAFLSASYDGNGQPNSVADAERNEWWCKGCRNRVTASPDGQRVYGCEPTCEFTEARSGGVRK
jgi:hypothetical protein